MCSTAGKWNKTHQPRQQVPVSYIVDIHGRAAHSTYKADVWMATYAGDTL